MEIKNAIVIIGLVTLFFAYIRMNENSYLGNNYHLNEINIKDREFTLIKTDLPLSHMIKLNEKFLICSGLNSPQIYITKEYLSNYINNGGIFLYNINNKNLENIELENYPSKLPFHPQGLSLYNIDSETYYLYVINHSIDTDNPRKNEERIEKFLLKIKMETISLEYKNTFSLSQNYFGTLKSIAAINHDIIYFTTQSYFSLPCYYTQDNEYNFLKYLNNAKFFIYEWMNILFQKFDLKKTFLYSYDWEKGEINIIANSEGISNRGLAYDRKNSLLYMVRPYEKDIKIFEISRNIPSNALLIKTIKTIYNIENIFYDEDNNKIYAGIYGSINELKNLEAQYKNEENFDLVLTFGGFEEFDIKNNYEISDIILFKNELKGISSAIKVKNDIFFSSQYQKGLLIFSKK